MAGSAWPRAAARRGGGGGGGIIREEGDGVGDDDEPEGVNDREHVRAIMGQRERGGLIIRTISCSNGRRNGGGSSGCTGVLRQIYIYEQPHPYLFLGVKSQASNYIHCQFSEHPNLPQNRRGIFTSVSHPSLIPDNRVANDLGDVILSSSPRDNRTAQKCCFCGGNERKGRKREGKEEEGGQRFYGAEGTKEGREIG